MNEQEEVPESWFTDRLVNIVVGVSYKGVIKETIDVKGIENNLHDKQQLLQNMRSIIFNMDRWTPEFETYDEKISELKATIEDLEFEVSKVRYGL